MMTDITEPIQMLEIPVSIGHLRGNPCVVLKKTTSDMELIKTILSSAFHNRPLIIIPKFTDKTQTINSLIQKGIIYRAEDGQYYYTF